MKGLPVLNIYLPCLKLFFLRTPQMDSAASCGMLIFSSFLSLIGFNRQIQVQNQKTALGLQPFLKEGESNNDSHSL